jgi:hypothetical protein
MARRLLVASLIAILCGCGQAGDQAAEVSASEQPRAAQPQALREKGDEAPKVSLPQIAYTYEYAFRLPYDAVASTQEAHVKLCEQLGPDRCRIASLERSASSGEFISGTTKLLVAAPIARAFGDRIVASATRAGADTVQRGIVGEDLSKQIVDTDARVRTKQALVDRLTVLLQTRSGNMAQAVEAERAINAAQEELEQARSWLAEMRGRVAMSTINIRYESGSRLGGGFVDPLRRSVATMGNLFGESLGFIILLFAALLPWAVLIGGAFAIWRWVSRRLPRKRQNETGEAPPDEIPGTAG